MPPSLACHSNPYVKTSLYTLDLIVYVLQPSVINRQKDEAAKGATYQQN